jgi:predicted nucleotide-binding protein (sugar kinase/HSP70/actin superfamily)
MVNNTTCEEVIFLGIKIGIPRGLYFYKYYPFAKAFLTELGAEIIPSPETNKEILDIGFKYCIDDACLPVKIYHGHTDYLKDKVDYMLIPRLTSVSLKEYICPKFGGLPEMIKFSMPKLPTIIDIEIDMYKSKRNLTKSLYSLGLIATKNPWKIKKAIHKAMWEHNLYKTNLLKGYLPEKLIDGAEKKSAAKSSIIGIVSHPYLLHDSFINMKLLEKLSNKGIKYITPEMVDPQVIDDICNKLEKRMFWSSGKILIGSALYMMNNDKIDGMLILTSFGCGVDSLSIELIYRLAKKTYEKPLMTLTFDEHTGEANFNTRLEAFTDLIDRRIKH